MGKLEQFIYDRFRTELRVVGRGDATVAFGLWCPVCGADTYPVVGHRCDPEPADVRGILEALR